MTETMTDVKSYPQYKTSPLSPETKSYPPVPKTRPQNTPTHIEARDIKYNAFNFDRISVDIMGKRGFNGVVPDLVIWDRYAYHVQDVKLNVDEQDLTNFAGWTFAENGLKDFNLDFKPGNRALFKGKFPLAGALIPFNGEFHFGIREDNKIVITIKRFSAVFPVPAQIQAMIIDELIKADPLPSDRQPMITEAFDLRKALTRVGNAQLVLDLAKLPTPVNLPFISLQTTEAGMDMIGGTKHIIPTTLFNPPPPPPRSNDNVYGQ